MKYLKEELDTIKGAMRKFNEGVKMTDPELLLCLHYYNDMEKLVRVLGPEFSLFKVEIGRLLSRFENIADIRKVKPTDYKRD